MKKSLSIILIIVLVLSCGCAKKDTTKKTEPEIKSSVVDFTDILIGISNILVERKMITTQQNLL